MSIGVVPERSLRSLLKERLLTSFIHGAVKKESAEIDCSELDFPFHAQVHDSIVKIISVSANKTLLEILLGGLNIYLTTGEHTSIAYTDLKNISKI